MMFQRRFSYGFTLVELLVAIAIIGIVMAITLPAVQLVRETARRASCANNVRQVALALLNYESTFDSFPAGIKAVDAPNNRSLSWLAQVLPQIEQDNTWDAAMESFQNDPNPFAHIGLRTLIPTYACPSDPRSGEIHWTHENRIVASTDYLGVNGVDYTSEDGILFRDSRVRINEVVDGLSSTLIVGERPPSSEFWYGWWYCGYGQLGTGSVDMLLGVRELNEHTTYELNSCPIGPYSFGPGRMDQACDAMHFWSHHPGGAHFAFAGGELKFFPYDAASLLSQLATRDGREVVAGF
jgi:prepilin-type N-terminal cleavage/methylation domain-containing protein